jgi:hypothetical protein
MYIGSKNGGRMVSDNKNSFGMESHPTDSLIHWANTTKESKNLAKSYRACYDKIVAAGCLLELDTLMQASYQEGCSDAHEEYAGEDL